MAAAAGLCMAACIHMPTRLLKGPGNTYYLEVNEKDTYICELKEPVLDCTRKAKFQMDRDYHQKPGYFKNDK